MKIDFVFKQLIEKLGATPMDANEGQAYLSNTEKLIAGFHLQNTQLNYNLLTERDLLSMSEKKREWCVKNCRSLFDDILLIFYRNENNKPTFRIINGKASRLFLGLCEIWKTIEIDD